MRLELIGIPSEQALELLRTFNQGTSPNSRMVAVTKNHELSIGTLSFS